MENTKFRHNPSGISQFKEAQAEYLCVLQHQNTYWRQRAKQFWLKEGDSNTVFFHKAVKRRQQTNRIMKLRDNNGMWIERGWVLRDDKGKFIAAMSVPGNGVFTPSEAEGMAIREALSWLKEKGITKVQVETDALQEWTVDPPSFIVNDLYNDLN
nr:uncharacterized protein LOC109167502 [Ipomoea batatas]